MSIRRKKYEKELRTISKQLDTVKDAALWTKFAPEYNKQLDTVKDTKLRTELVAEYNEKIEEYRFGSNLEIIHNSVEKAYLNAIASQYRPIPSEIKDFSYPHRARMLKIKKWVTEEKELALDKLVNVYSTLSGVECSVALVFRRVKTGTSVYFVITNQSDRIDPAIVDSYYDLFTSALKGNFPGVETEEVPYIGTYQDPDSRTPIGEWFSDANSNAVAMITNVASESSEKFISQGIEKLLDGVVPTNEDTEYTLILLASPVPKQEIYAQAAGYGDMYTQLSPFASYQVAMNKTESVSRSKTSSDAVSVGMSTGVSASGGVNIGFINASVSKFSSTNTGNSHTNSITNTGSESVGKTLTSTETNYRIKETLENIEANIKRFQQGEALGLWNFATYVLADTYPVAQSVANMYRSLTQGEESYVESAAVNLWNDNRSDQKEAIRSIHGYLKAFSHPIFALKELDVDDKDDLTAIEEKVKASSKAFRENIVTMPAVVNGYTQVNGRELAMAMNLPTAAVSGLPVIECAEFGRDVISQSADSENAQKIKLGNIFHMQQEEKNKPVLLDADCMTEHTFITGSTGAGKSTTVYRILSEASELKTGDGQNVTFMVIEPAKGEYKQALARLSKQPINAINVYRTNPKETDGEQLRINPFAFHTEKIHILEHLDRLIEIFNVCWPMYAAMPAVLKKGIEEAYIACGWDLLRSENSVSNAIFPTFADVCRHIRTVIDESDYSAENKGNYKGALVTRLESLTNGINGLIFTADAIPDKTLFEDNAVVDLSRVGSVETKALIMGLLVMKLQEYRMTTSNGVNARLKHITVLEEAHNLLKRTSTEQSTEGSNLLGKSVEMLSNSIAEMRTYGEAFIIADQAPGLLDMSVIRNTNTKIIMRLPDYSDRELVGRAANLNDEQIVEVAKLRPGVAAVYYNGWINPVLCKILKSDPSEEKCAANSKEASKDSNAEEAAVSREEINHDVLDMLVKKSPPDNDIDDLVERMKKAGCPGELITTVYRYFDKKQADEKPDKKLLPKLLYLLFEPEKEIKKARVLKDGAAIREKLTNELLLNTYNISRRDRDRILLDLLHEHARREAEFTSLYNSLETEFRRTWRVKEV